MVLRRQPAGPRRWPMSRCGPGKRLKTRRRSAYVSSRGDGSEDLRSVDSLVSLVRARDAVRAREAMRAREAVRARDAIENLRSVDSRFFFSAEAVTPSRRGQVPEKTVKRCLKRQ